MARNRLVTKDNFEQQRTKFFSPVARPAQNQQVQTQSGPISPNYREAWNRQKTSGLYNLDRTPIFSAPGFKGKAKNARIHSQRVQYEQERRKAADATGLEGMRQEGQTARVGLRGQNQLASIGLQGQNQLANIGLSGQNQLANIGLRGQNLLANTRLLSKLEGQKNANGLSQEHRSNLLMKLGTAYEEAKMTGGVPKNKEGNFIDVKDWSKQPYPGLYDLLEPQQQELQAENSKDREPVTGPVRKRADGSWTNLLYTPQELFEETQSQELDAPGDLDNARFISDNVDTYGTDFGMTGFIPQKRKSLLEGFDDLYDYTLKSRVGQ